MDKLKFYEAKKSLFGMLLGTGMLVLGGVLAPTHRFLPGLLLTACAVVLYIWFSVFVAQKNWWDMRAVFSAIWLFTIGLASLRLTDYQVLWEYKTWLCMAAAYAVFILGSGWGIGWGESFQQRFAARKGWAFGRVRLELRDGRLFWVCFVVTLVGLLSFAASVAIRGFIPYFSSDPNAYVKFYTKFHVFSTAATMVSGLSYYVLITQKLSWWKKSFLVFSIVYSTFAFPTLVVSRGILMAAALSLLTVVFYLHGKKLWVLILCTAITLGFYAIGTNARGYTEEALVGFFEPSKIVATEPTAEPDPTTAESDPTTAEPDPTTAEPDPTTAEPDPTTAEPGENEVPNQEPVVFQLSGSAAFVYSYLTVSHDNFNLVVKNLDQFTYGVRQLVPFNVILRMNWVDEVISQHPYYQVRSHLNTINLIGDAYYDFGFGGVVVLMLIWSFAFGFIQGWYNKGKGIFSLVVLGIAMTPITLSFFASWMSLFQVWLYWGLVLIMFLVSYTTIDKKQR